MFLKAAFYSLRTFLPASGGSGTRAWIPGSHVTKFCNPANCEFDLKSAPCRTANCSSLRSLRARAC